MSINHGRAHILVPQELLHGPDVVAIFTEVEERLRVMES